MGRRGQAYARWGVLALGLGLGLAAGCLLELDHELACGDGHVDVLAGEQCDPRAPDSPHRTYCLEKNLGSGKDGKGEAVCNDECQIEADKDICAFCGDGIAAGGEACDGADLRGRICPSGKGQLRCKSEEDGPGLACTLDASACDSCGDGQFNDEVEECDFSTQCNDDEDCPDDDVCDEVQMKCVSPGEIALGVECITLNGPNGAYTNGKVTNGDCTEDCLYERRRCNYCGNDVLDGEYEDYGSPNNFKQKPEVCDGDAFDKDLLVSYCQELCTGGPNMTTLQLRCEFLCNDDCDGFEEQAWEEPVKESARCCVIGGEPCDGPGGFPCCYALDHPDDAENACLSNTLPKPLCRSG